MFVKSEGKGTLDCGLHKSDPASPSPWERTGVRAKGTLSRCG